MVRLDLKPGDRLHAVVWKVSYYDIDGPWRCAQGINGVVVNFGRRFRTWREAMDAALEMAGTP